MTVYDIGIIGCGVAGVFALHKISKLHKDVSVIAFDIGRPPQKRRQQLFGWLGCLPSGDGKLYLNNVSDVADLVGKRKANAAYNYFSKVLSETSDLKITNDRPPTTSLKNKLTKLGYNVTLNDYIQMYPSNIHSLSKNMATFIEENKNITFKFDNEILQVFKDKKCFTLHTEENEIYQCKKLIIACGRGGWRWVSSLYEKFGIIENNDIAKFGIRIEISSSQLNALNKSNCSLTKNDIEIGPFSWFGTIIPEDHTDMAISAYRSNENRWKSDKVSFSLIGNRPFPNAGFEQTNRIGGLSFVLANDRIIKERISTIMAGKSKISIMPEYDWIKEAISDLSNAMPEISTKAYFHFPTIKPLAPKIIIGDNLETEVPGLFVVGESAGIVGILSAALTGLIVANEVCK